MGIQKPEPGVFRQSFVLHYPDADAAGYVRLTSILNLLQIQAGEHTTSLGFDYRQNRDAGVFWVLSRLTVQLDRWVHWPCGPLTVDTWSRSTKTIFALRDFRFGTEEGWIGRASSAWVILKDRKPQRPEPWAEIYQKVSPEPPAALMPASLPPFEEDSNVETRAEPLVRHTREIWSDWEDLDMNRHVNNVNAVGWCVAQHDTEFLMHWRPSFLEVNFLAEMFAGQHFVTHREERAAADDQKTFDYVVIREEDQVPTLRLRIRYAPVR